jgi:hypothetical protein
MNMKKYKLIPALALVTLLSACGTKSPTGAKKPSFAKEGKEVEREDFFKDFDEKFALLDFNGSKYMTSSKKITSSYDYYSKFELGSSEEVRVSNTQINKEEGNIDVDVDNYILLVNQKGEYVSDSKSANGAYNKSTSKETYKYQAQKMQYGDQEYFGDADLVNKMFYIMGVIDDSHPLAEMFDDYLKGGFYNSLGLTEFSEMVQEAREASEIDLPLFKFSINKNTYTCNYSFEEVYKQKDGEDNLIYSKTTKNTAKVQVVMEDDSFKMTYYTTRYERREFEAETTYNGYRIRPGDYVEINDSVARVSNVKDANVKLSLVDVSDFELVD